MLLKAVHWMRPRRGTVAADAGQRPQRLGLVLMAAGLAMFIVDLDFFALNLAVPKMATELDTSATNTAFCVSTFASTLYLQQVEDYSPLAGGLIFLAASGTVALAGPLSGRLGERYDVARLMAVAIVLGAVGLAVVSTGPAIAVYVAGLAAFGFGYGLGWALTSVAALIETLAGGATTQGEAIEQVLRWVAIGSAAAAIALVVLRGAATRRGAAA